LKEEKIFIMRINVYTTVALAALGFYNKARAQANQQLSNLTSPTAVNVNLLPNQDNKRDLGSAGKSWRDIYLDGSLYLGGARFLAYNLGTGTNNTAVGSVALQANTSGADNTAAGYNSLFSNTTGFNNTATGSNSLKSNTTGFRNTGFGAYALQSNTTASDNTAIGEEALTANSTGSFNTAAGSGALAQSSTGHENTASGAYALGNNTIGSRNVANGMEALRLNTTGDFNTAVGQEALYFNETGFSNVAVGAWTLRFSTTQSNLVAIGDSALFKNGAGASSSLDGTANVAVGSKALYSNTTGRANSGVGYNVLFANTTGIHNTGLGYLAGNNITTGNNNTFVGYNANSDAATISNSTAVGSGAVVASSNNFVFGNSSVVKWGFGKNAASTNIIDFVNTTAKLTTGGAWTNASDKKLKDNFQKLDRQDILGKISKLDIERWHYIKDEGKTTHIGPVAQDFYDAFKVGDDTTISTIDPSGIALIGIQQLAANDAEKDARIHALQKEVDELKTMIQTLQQNYASCSPCVQLSQQPIINELSAVNGASLWQNVPNPFDHTTTITYALPQEYSSAKIIFTDKRGRVFKEANLTAHGKGSMTTNGSTLASGTYQYSLYVDGKLIDTKQFVVAK